MSTSWSGSGWCKLYYVYIIYDMLYIFWQISKPTCHTSCFCFFSVTGVDEGMSYSDWCDVASASFQRHVFSRQTQPSLLYTQLDPADERFTGLREKRRLQKQKYRARLSEERRRQINLKERERYAKRRAVNTDSASFHFDPSLWQVGVPV